MRLERASRLLREGKHSVSEVAYQVGFESLSYFSKSFQEEFGTSPSEYTRKRDSPSV
jgi:AraC-like DNA-binding protein